MKANEIIEQCNELLEDKTYFLQTIELTKDEIKVLFNEIESLNSILDTLEQDMALLNATGKKEIKPKYVFDRIIMLREGVDKE